MGIRGSKGRTSYVGPASHATGRVHAPALVYDEMAARHPDAAVVVPPRSNAVPSSTANTEPTQRDRHIRDLAEWGRMGWQAASGYNWRALVEADVSRFKRVIGGGLRSRTDRCRATEVAIAVRVLNCMLDLGRPEYVRTA